MVEDLFRSRGVDPAGLPPPCGVSAATAAAATASIGRYSTAPTSAAGHALLPDPADGKTAMAGKSAMKGATPAAGGGVGARGGGGGGGQGAWHDEVADVLKRAGCLKHLERFKKDQLDIESLQLMRDTDYHKMKVTEVGAMVLLWCWCWWWRRRRRRLSGVRAVGRQDRWAWLVFYFSAAGECARCGAL